MVKSKGCSMGLITASVFLLLVIGFSVYLGSTSKKQHIHEGLENGRELVLVHMDGCPHCVSLMPKWDAASKKNNTGIPMRSVEHTEDDGPELTKRHNISGFPTIMLLNNGKKEKDYNGERSQEGILEFLKGLVN